MAEQLVIQGRDISALVRANRVPRIVEGWPAGPFCVIPPEGAAIDSELLNEQIGAFREGYGDILFLSGPEKTKLSAFLGQAFCAV